MADFDKISINGTYYNVKDSALTAAVNALTSEVGEVQGTVTQQGQAIKQQGQTIQQQGQQIENIGKTPYANVLAYGADPTGTNDSSTAFNDAKNSGNVIFVPYGTYNIQSFRPENCKMVIAPNVTLKNQPSELPNGPQPTFLAVSFEENAPSYAEFAIQSYDDSTDQPPSAGWVKSAFRIDHHVRSTNNYFSWALCVVLDNATENTSTENTAFYAQAIAQNDTKTWGMLSEIRDTGRNPNYGKVGMEITCRATGPDVNNNRVGIDVAIHNTVNTPDAEKVAWGYGVRVGSDGPSTGNITSAFRVSGLQASSVLDVDNVTVTGNAIDLSKANITGNAISLGPGQNFNLENFRIVKEIGQNRLLFQIDGSTVAYMDGSGFHNGTP